MRALVSSITLSYHVFVLEDISMRALVSSITLSYHVFVLEDIKN